MVRALYVYVLIAFSTSINAQQLNLFYSDAKNRALPELRGVEHYVYRAKKDGIKWLSEHRPEQFTWAISKRGHFPTLRLYRVDERAPAVRIWNGSTRRDTTIDAPLMYVGTQDEGTDTSLAIFYLRDGQLYGFFSVRGRGNFEIAPRDPQGAQYVLFRSDEMVDEAFSCSAIDRFVDRAVVERINRQTCKMVRLSVHADHDMYVKMGRDVGRVAQYVMALFRASAEIYRRDGIHIRLTEIVVHTAEDYLPHTSALDDLWAFRNRFKQYDGDMVICVSGYTDSQGRARLGGVAYTNALCVRRYAYAYANIRLRMRPYPSYSWDVHVFTHECGHVLGSPHTHECVWGPQRNRPIDGCYPPSGSCRRGPIPQKGTIMSYCHLPGNPGVDFTLGFGSEPAQRIRNKIASSACLIDYVPMQQVHNQVVTIQANVECTDGTITHYYFDNHTVDEDDDVWLLSVDTRGQDIGHIGDPAFEVSVTLARADTQPLQINAPYVSHWGTDFRVIRRWWRLNALQPISQPVTVIFPFTTSEWEGLKSLKNGMVPQDVTVFRIANPATANPLTHHGGAQASQFHPYRYAASGTDTTFQWTVQDSIIRLAFQIPSLQWEGGAGVFFQTPLAAKLHDFWAEVDREGILLHWLASDDGDLSHYQLFHADKDNSYRMLARIPSDAHSTEQEHYRYTHQNPAAGTNYYILKLVHQDGYVFDEQKLVVYYHSDTESNALQIFPTMVQRGADVHISVPHSSQLPMKLLLFNTRSQKVQEWMLYRHQSTRRIDLAPGVYLLTPDRSREVYRLFVR